jgi:glycosyltransferase involved in cell wall biosynthesis
VLVVNGVNGEVAEGGAENSVRLAVDGLRERGFLIDYFHSERLAEGVARRRDHGSAAKAISHAMERWRGARNEVAAAISGIAPDLIWTNNLAGVGTWIWRYAQAHRIPVLHTLRDYYLLCGRVARFDRGRVCESECTRCRVLTWPGFQDASGVTHVVGNSQRTLDLHVSSGWFRDKPRSVIYPAPGGITCGASSNKSPVAGFIGKHCDEKGLSWLLEQAALASLPATLVLAGKPLDSYQRAYESASARLLGYVSPERFYEQVDIVIVPSVWEDPYPRVVHEAVACGRVVVGADVGGISEASSRMPGVILYQANDAASFRRAMMQAVEIARDHQDARRLAGAAWASTENEECVARYEAAFKSLLLR